MFLTGINPLVWFAMQTADLYLTIVITVMLQFLKKNKTNT